MRLYIRHDLFKAATPPPAPKAAAKLSPPKLPTGAPDTGEGGGQQGQMTPCPYGGGQACIQNGGNGAKQHKAGGSIMQRHQKAVQSGNKPDADDQSRAEAVQDESKDPLKTSEEIQKEPTTNLDEAAQAAQEVKIDDPGEDFLSPFEATPYTLDAEAHAGTDPLEHYHAAKLAEKLGDDKMAHFHREQARQKVTDASDHHFMAQQLREAGMPEDAKHHTDQHRALLKEKVRAAGDKLDQQLAQMSPGELAAHRRRSANAMGQIQAKQELKEAAEGQKMAPTQFDEGEDAQGTGAQPEGQQEAQQAVEQIADKADEAEEADKKHQELADQFNQGGETDKRVQEARKNAQEAATKKFEEKSAEYEEQSQAYEQEIEQHKQAMQEYEEDLANHKAELDRISDRLKAVKKQKPVKDDKESRKLKQQLKTERRELQRHNDNKPSDKKLKKLQDKLKAHEANAPAKPKNESQLKSYEKKLAAHEKKKKALQAQVDTVKKEHELAKEAHKEEAAKRREKIRKLDEKQEKVSAKESKAHQKALDKWSKKHEQTQKELETHKKEKSEIQKPKPPKAKEPEQTHRAPESREDKLKHEDHTKQAKQLAESIESHLRDNADLDDQAKERLHTLHEQALEMAEQQHVPTKEDTKALRDAVKRAKEHGAHEHHDKKVERDEQQKAKEQAKQEKEQAKQEKEEDRPPEGMVEEAELHQHQKEMNQKAEDLRNYMNESDDLSDEDKEHLLTLIEHYEAQADNDMLPGNKSKQETKKIDQLAKEHLKAAKEQQKAEESEEAKGAAFLDQEQQQQESSADAKTKRSRGSLFVSAYNRGRAFGARFGAAAASPYGTAGGGTDMLDYAGQGILHVGYTLLGDRKHEKHQPGASGAGRNRLKSPRGKK